MKPGGASNTHLPKTHRIICQRAGLIGEDVTNATSADCSALSGERLT